MLKITEIIDDIQDQNKFQQQIEILNYIIRNDNLSDSKKNQTRNLLMILSDIVNDKNITPRTKFYCIKTAKYFTDKKYPTFIHDLGYSALFEDMVRLAKTVDPEKQPQKKGRNYFAEEPEIGNQFITLIQKCIMQWAQEFPKNQNLQTSKFKKSYQQLRRLEVIFPTSQDQYQDAEFNVPVDNAYNNFNSSYKMPQEHFKKQYQQSHYNILGPNDLVQNKQQELNVNNFFDKINQPSPFQVIRNQMNQNTFRNSKQPTYISNKKQNKSYSRMNINNSARSHDVTRVFSTTIKLDKNDYDGTIINNSLSYWEQISDLNPQHLKRFKVANFKDKSILFQDNCIQVGFKSKLLYENFENFKVLLKIIIYYDNNTESDVTQLQNEFEGDQTNLLYSTKKKIDTKIRSKDQITQQLLIVPLNILMNLIQMKIKYSHQGEVKKANIFLPSTILKFTTFMDIQVSEIRKKFQQKKASILRTDPFKLNRHFSPEFIKKNFGELKEITKLQDFIDQKTYVEYELGGLCDVVKIEECLIKIIVRIDMKVVIQVLPLRTHHYTDKLGVYSKSLLQALQFLLQQDSL